MLFNVILQFYVLLIIVRGNQINPSSSNYTWKFIEHPISHFARANTGSYQQRRAYTVIIVYQIKVYQFFYTQEMKVLWKNMLIILD